jgi:TolA-binding protein
MANAGRGSGPLGSTSVEGLVSGAQEVAGDAAKRLRETVQDAVTTIEKRRDVELKNLRGRLRDLNTNIGGLERRYRTLEKRVTKQVETLSGRTVKASDLDKRLRTLEKEIRRLAGLGASAASATRRASTAGRGTAARRATSARKPAARKTTARKPAARTTAAPGAPRRPAARRSNSTRRRAG